MKTQRDRVSDRPMRRGRRSGAAVGVLWSAAVLALWPAAAQPQSLRPFYASIVRVECRLPNGESLVSTGFAWREPELVVTALHGAAGCASLSVFNETTTKRSPATVQRAHLESDLALLKLERGLDMKPLQHLTSAPELNQDRYTVVGYPQGIRRLDTDEVRFSDGTQGWMTSLDVFDDLKGAKEMFTGVLFPSKAATIFRVKSALAPGQSGAPILDSKGRVVAIVDGGMLGSVSPLNWSMPAHKYLAALAESTNAPPTQPSRWAGHFSQRVEAEPKFVALPERRVAAGATAESGALRRLRTMTLGDLEQLLKKKGEWESDGGNIKFIRETVKAQDLPKLTFDIYFDPVTRATFGVPSLADLTWNPQLGLLESTSASGMVGMFIGVKSAASYAQNKTTGKRAFTQAVAAFGSWPRSPNELVLKTLDDEEWASGASVFRGKDQNGDKLMANVSVTLSGKQLLGYAVLGPEDIVKELTPLDRALFLMMQYGAMNLTDFAQQ